MKTLYIMRHAQKDTSNPDADDYDIKLTKQGIEDANKISQILKDKNILPDLIVASPAIRTKQTVEIVAPKIGYDKNIMYNEVLFQAFVNEVIESITYTFDNVDSLMIVGHNPSLTALGVMLVGLKEKILMGEVVKIEFDCSSWTSIDKSNARLIEHIKFN